jgi:hypothetical protein
MQSLPAPAWGLGRRAAAASRRRRLVAVLAAAALLALAAAGVLSLTADDSGPAPGAHASAPGVALINGHALQSATCSDWNAGTADQQTAIVAALKYDVGGPTGYGPASTLPDADAQALFTRACGSRIATNWLLYEMYIRAAGFQSYRR